LRDLQPEHPGPPQLGRALLRGAPLPLPEVNVMSVESVKQILLASSAGWVLWLLGLLSASSIVLALERWMYLRRRGVDLEALARQLDEHLQSNDFARARQLLEASPAVAARVADAGLPLARPRTTAAATT